jgi:ethanolamine utilization protein EutA
VWAHEDIYDHEHLTEEDKAKIADYIWRQETVELKTVGIDIGSSTSHLLFAKILMQREAQELSSRFVTIAREVVWQSPIMLTPFLPDGSIDAGALERFIDESYRSAGIEKADIDSGAVILTGEAIKRTNAQAIDELFAGEAGKFVCATAGHKLEATLAAHGSGAVKLSKDRDECVLHVDIGGGTTKLALIDRGRILGVSAFAVGGRLLATDETGTWSRIDESARLAAEDLRIPVDRASFAKLDVRERIAQRLAGIAMQYIAGLPLDALGTALGLTEPLVRSVRPDAITLSGGVSEYLFGRENTEYGDIAKLLAGALRTELGRRAMVPVVDPGAGIRATVIGASQFTVQVSGKTIYLPAEGILPIHNVPVVHLELTHLGPEAVQAALEAGIARLDLRPEARMAISFSWREDPEYHRLMAVARALIRVVAPEGRREQPLLLMVDGDVGKTLGHLIDHELGLSGSLISIDGVQLQEFDFVDVGDYLDPPGVVPLVIKSLLFA